MMKQWEGQVTVLSDVLAPVGAAPAAKTNQPQV
jgi:hypothetical protein